jgi:hypothetical protein
MLHEQITEDIIGAAMAVLNELRPGLDEKLHENALIIELQARGHSTEQQREYPVGSVLICNSSERCRPSRSGWQRQGL